MKNTYKRIKGITKFILVIMLLTVVLFPQTASAASVDISVSGGTIETGETVTVTVKLSSSATIGAFKIYLKYDSSVIEYVPSSGDDSFCNGGAGQLIFVGDPYSKSASYSVKFKGLKAGSSSLSISYDSGDILDDSYNDMTVSASSGKVTVNAPREASSDATLSSLKVGDGTLSPSFSSSVTEYSINVNANTDELTISATPNSKYAKVSIKDNNLSEGENTVRVVVTAENGDQKTYYIYVTKAEATPSPTPEPTPTPTETPIPTPGVEIIAKAFGTDESGNAVIKEDTYTISDVITAEIPAGFDMTTLTFSGVEVQALKLNDGDLTLIQLSDANLYIYDSASGVCSRYQILNTAARNYIIETVATELIPLGYYLTAVEINGAMYPAYTNSADSEFVLVFVEGGTWYSYDTVENTLQRFITPVGNGNHESVITGPNVGPVSPTDSVASDKTATASTVGKTPNGLNILAITRLVITVLVFALAIIFMILFVRERNRNLMYIAEEKEEQLAEEFSDDIEDYTVGMGELDLDEESETNIEEIDTEDSEETDTVEEETENTETEDPDME